MSIINIEQLDKVNEQLEAITSLLDEYCEALNKEIDSYVSQGQEAVQEKIDEEVQKLSDKVTEKAEPIRKKLINVLHSQYEKIEEKIKPIKPLVNANISLNTVVDIVKSMIAIMTYPYQPYIEYLTILAPKLLELSNNLQTLATYQPTLTIPEEIKVQIPPLSANVGTITIDDVINGVEE